MTYLHQIDPIAFSLGPVAVHWYGIMYLFGFAAAWWLGNRRIAAGRLPGVNADAFSDLLFYSMIGVVLFMILASFAVFLFNVFGTDPEGFQALVLLPTPRKRYLLGKNLAFFPIVGTLFALFAGLAAMLMRPVL